MEARPLRTSDLNLPMQAGERARLRLATSPEHGLVFIVFGERATIGRGDAADIQIPDSRVSRVHAELLWDSGSWKLRDLGSQNGVVHQGRLTREARLRSGDIIGFGDTLLEFITVRNEQDLKKARVKSREELKHSLTLYEGQRASVERLAVAELPSTQKPVVAPAPTDQNKKNRLIILVAGIGVLAYLTQSGDENQKKSKKIESKKIESIVIPLSKLPNAYQPATSLEKSHLQSLYRSGFREFKQKNFLRARSYFETILQVDPGHQNARSYVDQCNRLIEKEVLENLKLAKSTLSSNRLMQSKAYYEQVLRLLARDQDHPHAIEAKEQILEIERTQKSTCGGCP